jgi:1-aminocyclopropane-1-carboxylate deaminase
VKNDAQTNNGALNLKKEFRTDTPLMEVDHPVLNDKRVTLIVKREDLIHPHLSGNKWYKLKYNLIEAKKQEHDTLLTFGGAYSNHIYATAAVGEIFNIKTIGVIRGEEYNPLNSTLSFAKKCGMKFHYLDRGSYRKKTTSKVIKSLKEKFGRFFLIPEGGSNSLAVKGCAEITGSIKIDFNYVCCAVGTGGTLAGLAASLEGNKKALGFSILKGAEFLNDNVKKLLKSYSKKEFRNWQINFDYHFGGYSKFEIELINFIEEFQYRTSIPIEPIYTGKMIYGIFDLVKKGFFTPGTTIIAIHTGGLQGLAGLYDKIKHLKSKAEKLF